MQYIAEEKTIHVSEWFEIGDNRAMGIEVHGSDEEKSAMRSYQIRSIETTNSTINLSHHCLLSQHVSTLDSSSI